MNIQDEFDAIEKEEVRRTLERKKTLVEKMRKILMPQEFQILTDHYSSDKANFEEIDPFENYVCRILDFLAEGFYNEKIFDPKIVDSLLRKLGMEPLSRC